jgi:hypothetical protein
VSEREREIKGAKRVHLAAKSGGGFTYIVICECVCRETEKRRERKKIEKKGRREKLK